MNEIDLRRFDLNLLVVFEVLMVERSWAAFGVTTLPCSTVFNPDRPVGDVAAAWVSCRVMDPQPVTGPPGCGWLVLHPWAPCIERAMLE